MPAFNMVTTPVHEITKVIFTFAKSLSSATTMILVLVLMLVQVAATYDAGLLPLVTNQSICAVPPGILASDGLDDVCLLAGTCCPKGWTSTPGTATLSSGAPVNCGTVICPNVCRMACDRQGTSEACTNSPFCQGTSTHEAYVFIRRSAAAGAGHPGFGFRAAENLYFYGGLENPPGLIPVSPPVVLPGSNNGFWMQNGTQNDMFCAMKNPPIGSDTAYDDDYKIYMDGNIAEMCQDIMPIAEGIYSSGYRLLGSNSLDAVYNILSAYNIEDLSLPSDEIAPILWYNSLDPNAWKTQNISTLSGCTSPVVTCTSTPTTSTSTTSTSTTSTASSTPSNTPNYCIGINYCLGDCNGGVSPFQGATASCPCPGGLVCNCTSNSSASGLPICYDALQNVVPISSGSGCGICNCPAVVGPPLTFDPTGISCSCSCSCNLCSTYNLC